MFFQLAIYCAKKEETTLFKVRLILIPLLHSRRSLLYARSRSTLRILRRWLRCSLRSTLRILRSLLRHRLRPALRILRRLLRHCLRSTLCILGSLLHSGLRSTLRILQRLLCSSLRPTLWVLRRLLLSGRRSTLCIVRSVLGSSRRTRGTRSLSLDRRTLLWRTWKTCRVAWSARIDLFARYKLRPRNCYRIASENVRRNLWCLLWWPLRSLHLQLLESQKAERSILVTLPFRDFDQAAEQLHSERTELAVVNFFPTKTPLHSIA